jgi:glycosyltransferase involved in cell wall biosynthesis
MPSKRFDDLIATMAEVRILVPTAELVIVGDGYERPALEEQIASIGAQPWIRLAGRVSDEELLSLYRKAWLVASASIAEGWGMTLTEAAGCGTPSVATDIAGHRDSVAPNLSGLLARTPREFTEQIAAVLTNTALRDRLSVGALQHAATLTWTTTALGTFTPLAEDAIRRQKGRR